MRRFKQCGNGIEAEACSSIHLASTVAQESAEGRGSHCPGRLLSLSGHHPALTGCRGRCLYAGTGK